MVSEIAVAVAFVVSVVAYPEVTQMPIPVEKAMPKCSGILMPPTAVEAGIWICVTSPVALLHVGPLDVL